MVQTIGNTADLNIANTAITITNNVQDRLAPEAFCFWLQGFIEMSGATSINEEQMKVLKEHLELVFRKVATQSYTPGYAYTPGITVPPGVAPFQFEIDPYKLTTIC